MTYTVPSLPMMLLVLLVAYDLSKHLVQLAIGRERCYAIWEGVEHANFASKALVWLFVWNAFPTWRAYDLFWSCYWGLALWLLIGMAF